MNIWLVTIGEPIPHLKNNLRLHRTGIIANIISKKTSHSVTWWTSDFNHFQKNHIFGNDTILQIEENYTLIALHGRGYKKNISVDRILDHKEIAKKFRTQALKYNRPDIIVASFPTLGLCQECVELGKKWGVPVIIDYRDMWPEVFVEIAPNFLKPLIRLCLISLFLNTKKMFLKASGIIGITDDFLKLGLNKIERKTNKNDEVFPLAYLSNQFNNSQLDEANIFWEKTIPRSNKLRIIFIGTLGYQFDLITIINAVELLNQKGICNFEVILCGSGDKEESLKIASLNNKNIILPGYITAAQIRSLLLKADIGLCPYNVNQAFLSSIPGKAIEYMSAGLPILTTLEEGELGKFCKKNEFGFFYEVSNPLSLADAISNLIMEKDKLKILNSNIISVYNENFEADNAYMKYIKHLENVVNK